MRVLCSGRFRAVWGHSSFSEPLDSWIRTLRRRFFEPFLEGSGGCLLLRPSAIPSSTGRTASPVGQNRPEQGHPNKQFFYPFGQRQLWRSFQKTPQPGDPAGAPHRADPAGEGGSCIYACQIAHMRCMYPKGRVLVFRPPVGGCADSVQIIASLAP